jgi:hypothetical protein
LNSSELVLAGANRGLGRIPRNRAALQRVSRNRGREADDKIHLSGLFVHGIQQARSS